MYSLSDLFLNEDNNGQKNNYAEHIPIEILIINFVNSYLIFKICESDKLAISLQQQNPFKLEN